jgi:hypothetical protein
MWRHLKWLHEVVQTSQEVEMESISGLQEEAQHATHSVKKSRTRPGYSRLLFSQDW